MLSHRLLLSLFAAACAAAATSTAWAAPVSRAGTTFLAYPGDTIVLDGSASQGHDLAWRWVQIGGPRVAATGTDTERPRFRADLPGRYTFELVVWEGDVSASPDTVDVVVADPEIADRYVRQAGCSQAGALAYSSWFPMWFPILFPMWIVSCRSRR